MSTQNQPTIADLKRRFAAYSLAGGALWYTRWLECELCNALTRLEAAEECIDELSPKYLVIGDVSVKLGPGHISIGNVW